MRLKEAERVKLLALAEEAEKQADAEVAETQQALTEVFLLLKWLQFSSSASAVVCGRRVRFRLHSLFTAAMFCWFMIILSSDIFRKMIFALKRTVEDSAVVTHNTPSAVRHPALLCIFACRVLLRSERVMTELSTVDRWVKFCPLYCGRCLGNLIMCYVGHSSRYIKGRGREPVRC